MTMTMTLLMHLLLMVLLANPVFAMEVVEPMLVTGWYTVCGTAGESTEARFRIMSSDDGESWTGSYSIDFETTWGDGNGEKETQVGFVAGETHTVSFPHTYVQADTYLVTLKATLQSDGTNFDGMVADYSEFLRVSVDECESDVAAPPPTESPVFAPIGPPADRGFDGVEASDAAVTYRLLWSASTTTLSVLMSTTLLLLIF